MVVVPPDFDGVPIHPLDDTPPRLPTDRLGEGLDSLTFVHAHGVNLHRVLPRSYALIPHRGRVVGLSLHGIPASTRAIVDPRRCS